MCSESHYSDRVAENYDKIRALMFGDEAREAALRRAGLTADMVVADIGEGAGFIAESVAPLVRRVYALDVSAVTLAAAQSKLQRFDNAELRLIGGDNLSLENNSIDVVFANMYLHHAANPLAAIREIARVLKTGGQLVITDFDKHEHEWMRREMADVWLGFDRTDVREWLIQLGLVNVEVDSAGGLRSATSGQDHEVSVGIFVARGTKPNPGMKAEVARSYNALADQKTLRDDASSLYYRYSAEEIRSLPEGMAAMSLGCGNPVAHAALQAGEVVLDLGCGAGIDVFLAASEVGAAGRVIGVDIAASLLSRAGEMAAKEALAPVALVCADGEALPIASDCVDVVISNAAINLAIDKVQVFREAYRVLRGGGHLCVADIVTDGPLPMSLRNKPAEWVRCFSGALTREDCVCFLESAGFVEVSIAPGEMIELYGEVSAHSVLVRARKP